MIKLLDVRYLGRCKDKGRGSQAFGYVDGAWFAIFPETVLREWFEGTTVSIPGQNSTLYAILGVKQDDTADAIKTGYRRMALQWHPDRNHDPDAKDQFIRIQEAYNILNDPIKRGRYDAGLKLQATIDKSQDTQYRYDYQDTLGYRAPLKCGYVMVDGQQSGKWYIVTKILGWEDIVLGNKVLSTSWPMGAQAPLEQWL